MLHSLFSNRNYQPFPYFSHILFITGSSRANQEFSNHVQQLLHTGGSASFTDPNADVLIFPTFQQEPIGITADYDAFRNVLDIASRFDDVDLFLTSGYVNFPKEVAERLARYRSTLHFLFAAPQANSFFHDPGFASVIPALYNIVRIRL